jgi:hypothetical protein
MGEYDWKDAKKFFDRVMASPDVELHFARFKRNQCQNKRITFFDCEALGNAKVFWIFLQEGDCNAEYSNHYNVVVKRDKTMYLFEPAKTDSNTLMQLLKIHFPEFSFKQVDFHPQTDEKDRWCMAYICMFAQAFLKDKSAKKSIKDIAKEAMQESPIEWYARMQTEHNGMLQIPSGHLYESHHAPLEKMDFLHFFH